MRNTASGSPAHTLTSRSTNGFSHHDGHHLVVRAAIDTALEAYECAALARSSFTQLGALFRAIQSAADEGSQAKKLASIGTYLSEDWAVLQDSQTELLNSALDDLRGALTQSNGSEVLK